MQKREKYLLLAALGALVFLVVGPKIKAWLIAPITERQTQLAAIEQRIDKHSRDTDLLLHAVSENERWQKRSLPPDPLDAQRLYQVWLTDLGTMAGLDKLEVTPGRRYGKSGVYTAVQISLQAEAPLRDLLKFMQWFEQMDLAQRITALTIESPAAEGDPRLKISLTAEGLALNNGPHRHELFPRSSLQAALGSSSATQLEVASSEGFPKEPGFRIRIDKEYLTVDAIDGTKWTVQRGTSSTSPASHAAEATVELAPLRSPSDAPLLEPDDRLLAANPFVKPQPPRATPPTVAAVQPRPTYTPPRRDDAAFMSMVGMINEGEKPQAWLYDGELRKNLFVKAGEQLQVGDVQGVVSEVHASYMLLNIQSKVWRLDLGNTLRSMQLVSAAETPGSESADTPSASSDSSGDSTSEVPAATESTSEPAVTEPAEPVGNPAPPAPSAEPAAAS